MEKRLRLSVGGTIRFVILTGIAAWLWWFFRSYLIFAAIVLMVGSVLASALLLWHERDGFCVKAVLPEGRVGRDRSFAFDIRIDTAAKIVGFTADIEYRWGNVFTEGFHRKKEHLWIAPGKGVYRQQLLSSRYVGRLEVQIEKFLVYDPFHIFYLTDCKKQDAWVMVYPKPEYNGEEEIRSYVDGFPKEEELKKRGTDYNPDYEIREYIPGDELKSIHWKLTAKQNRLMVRERLATGKAKIFVLLPLSESKDENDGLMDALYSLCGFLLAKEYPIQLFWQGAGESLQNRYLAEQGELENVIGEILSNSGIKSVESAKERMGFEYPGEKYILIQTGAYKGAYVG